MEHRVLFIDGHQVKIRKNAWLLEPEAEGQLTSAWMSRMHLLSSTSGAESGLGELGEGVKHPVLGPRGGAWEGSWGYQEADAGPQGRRGCWLTLRI